MRQTQQEGGSPRASFTPGPWFIRGDTVGGHREIAGADGRSVVTVQGIGPILAVQDANASLIAASPTMYEALNSTLGFLEVNDPGLAAKVRAAILKAEGSQ